MNSRSTIVNVALADDHTLLRDALAHLINNFDGFRVLISVENGQELVSAMSKTIEPDVVLLDLNMPLMDGYETACWLQKNYPHIHVLMLTMYDSDVILIRLLKTGVKGFLKKDIHPSELRFALQSVIQSGYYYSNHATGKLINLFRNNEEVKIDRKIFSDQEVDFLKLICTDLTYKEIAIAMHLNPRSVDNLRDNLFNKLDVKSRVGLAMYSIKNGIATF